MWHQSSVGLWQKFCFFFCLFLYPSLGVKKSLFLLLFLVFRSVEIPLGKLLKGQPNVAKNIYSFGFGKVRCCGWGFSNDIRTFFFQNLLFLTVIIPPVLFLTFCAFFFSAEKMGGKKKHEEHKYPGFGFGLEEQKFPLDVIPRSSWGSAFPAPASLGNSDFGPDFSDLVITLSLSMSLLDFGNFCWIFLLLMPCFSSISQAVATWATWPLSLLLGTKMWFRLMMKKLFPTPWGPTWPWPSKWN